MKVCDAADWFTPRLSSIISSDLQDIPKFDRKQWEFAIIFDQLREAGVLRDDACGISFGAGRERLLYALANKVGRLWATDLYSATTNWPDARAADQDEHVRGDPEIVTRADRLSVKNMDMRQIEFPDETFDFAYSSSAVEHIGGWEDFRTHLAEVRRVLKPGGVYVMTTDIIYGPIWEDPHNFKFNPDGLRWWLETSGMSYRPVLDCRIARHQANTPLPSDLITCLTPDGDAGRPGLFRDILYVQMLMGRHPHSSVVLEMRKAPADQANVEFLGYEQTKDFLIETRSVWDRFATGSRLNPHTSPAVPAQLRDRIWSTAYIWLGGAPRTAVVQIITDGPGHVTIGVNKTHTDSSWVPVVDIPERIEATTGHIEFELTVDCHTEWNYAVYGNALNGLKLKNVSVSIQESGRGVSDPRVVRRMTEAQVAAAIRDAAQSVQAEPVRRRSAGIISKVNRILRPAGIKITRA
jgi:SAM-dependent methyltransferase